MVENWRGEILGQVRVLGGSPTHLPTEAWTFGSTVLVALVWRFLAIPWDFGGFFYQLWVALVGLVFFVDVIPQLNANARMLAQLILLPICALLQFGSLYFAPQALSPFLFVAFVVVGMLFLWSTARRSQALLVSLLLVPLSIYCLHGSRHMILLLKVRSLDPKKVSEVSLTSALAAQNIRVTESNVVANILSSLGYTSPYSPNHESIRQPWHVLITMRDGSSIQFSVGNGNRAHPESVWIEFGVEVYQNSQAFRAANLHLW